MLNNQYHGITAEDLEKAASVRLFEKAAAAEGLNLNELSDTQVDDLYSIYQHSSEENTMNEEIFDLFEKQAAYEGVDLDALSDDELAYVFDNFVDNLDADYDDDYGYYDEYDEEEEAYEKLAEAEILGRHMARAYMDEMEKEAAQFVNADGQLVTKSFKKMTPAEKKLYKAEMAVRKQGGERASARKLRESRLYTDDQRKAKRQAMEAAEAKRTRFGKAKELKGKAGYHGKRLLSHMKANKGLYAGGAALGLGAAGLGAAMSKEAMFNDILEERVAEFIDFGKEAGYDGSYMDDLAIQVLEDMGYDLSPLYY